MLEPIYDIKEAIRELKKIDEEYSEKELQAIERIKKKYPNAYIPKIDQKTGLPILPDELFGDWEY